MFRLILLTRPFFEKIYRLYFWNIRFLDGWETLKQGSDPSYQRAVIKYLEDGKAMDKHPDFEVLERAIDQHW